MAFIKEVNVPDNARKSAYVAAAYDVGTWVSLNGEFSASDITALGTSNSNKPGYASTGDKKLTQVTTGILGRVFPINKKIFIPEDSDTDHDSVAAGQMCIYYTEGQFETDQYTSVSGTGAAFGDYLKLTTGGKLAEEAAATTETAASVARVIEIHNGDDGGDTTKDSLIFEMIT